MSNNSDLFFQIAISLVKGIGPINAKKLIAEMGSAEAVFNESSQNLEAIEGLPKQSIDSINNKEVLLRAEKELGFLEKHGYLAHSFLDKSYPSRLRHCDDGPIVLFQKGTTNLNPNKSIAIVGTRSMTDYGDTFTKSIVRSLKAFNATIISGLAYGVDAAAHKASVEEDLPTIAVMAHGLDKVYPSLNHKLSEKILESGGSLLTEFLSQSKPDRENFPKRNRIIAGMSDAVLVIEAAKKGGALITAELANSYNRDVFALPGRYDDPFSEGCNALIKSNKAALFTSVKDIKYIMAWEESETPNAQTKLFVDLNNDEQKIYDLLLANSKGLELALICAKASKSISHVLQVLMMLEVKGLIKCLPGKIYKKI